MQVQTIYRNQFKNRHLVNRISRHCLRLRADPLRSFEIWLAILASYVGDARPVRYLQHLATPAGIEPDIVKECGVSSANSAANGNGVLEAPPPAP